MSLTSLSEINTESESSEGGSSKNVAKAVGTLPLDRGLDTGFAADLDASALAWSIEDSEDLYRIKGWGEPYFAINAAGNLTVSPQGDRGGSLDLKKLVEDLKLRDFQLPILIRFSEILADRVERINACFAKAIARYSYEGV